MLFASTVNTQHASPATTIPNLTLNSEACPTLDCPVTDQHIDISHFSIVIKIKESATEIILCPSLQSDGHTMKINSFTSRRGTEVLT